MVTEQNIQKFSQQCKDIFAQIERDVIGQKDIVEEIRKNPKYAEIFE